MKRVFYMNDVRDIFNKLKGEEISMSKALEMMNNKAEKAERAAFSSGWRLRMSRKSSEIDSAWTEWKFGDDSVVD